MSTTGSILMAQPHAQSGQVVSVRPLGEQLRDARTTALLKAEQLEIVRIVLHAGKALREHSAPGEITVQCLEGEVDFSTPDATHRLQPGDFVHLRRDEPHSLSARSDASLLLTICVA
jgi:quercetin dioxygenase-like cupin family protein